MRTVPFDSSLSAVKVELSIREKSCRGAGKSGVARQFSGNFITRSILRQNQCMIYQLKANLMQFLTYILS